MFKKLLFVIASVIYFIKSDAQTFPCDGKLYFFNPDTNGIDMHLAYVDNYTTGSPTVTNLCIMPVGTHNSLGANPVDHYLYYSLGQDVYRIDANCNFTLQCSAIPVTVSGCFDKQGRYWFTDNNTGNLYAYDLNNCTQVKGPFLLPTYGPDIVYNYTNDMIYLSCGGGSQIIIMDTLGIFQDTINTGSYGGNPTWWGGIAFGIDGRLYGVGNALGYIGAVGITSYSATVTNIINLDTNIFTGGSDMASFVCPYSVEVIPKNVSCFGDSDGTAAANVSGGIPDFKYEWMPGGQTTQSISGLNPGTYTVTVKDATDSTISASVTILNPPALLVNTSGSITICKGFNAVLSANATGGTPGYFYTWSNSSTGNSITVNPSSSSTYTVMISDANGCTDTAFAFVIVNNLPTVTVNPDVSICLGTSAVLTAVGANSYTWNPATFINPTNGSIVIADPPVSITYTVTGTDNNNCSNNASVKIKILPLPVIVFSGPAELCSGEDIATLTAAGGVLFLWSTGQTIQAISISVSGTYSVIVTDTNGCRNTGLFELMESCEGMLYIPNAFTPNKDNRNELFMPLAVSVTTFEMKIFNRWGELIFKSNDINSGWDGTYRGKEAKEDVYVWEINYQTTSKEIKNIVGRVALIK